MTAQPHFTVLELGHSILFFPSGEPPAQFIVEGPVRNGNVPAAGEVSDAPVVVMETFG